MSTIEGAVRQAVVDTNLFGPRVYRSFPPQGAQLPYSTFIGPLSLVPGLRGDGRTLARSRQLQVDSWHSGDDEEAAMAAFDTLVAALDGLRVPSTPKSFRLRVSLAVEVPDRSLVHHSLTLMVDHVA